MDIHLRQTVLKTDMKRGDIQCWQNVGSSSPKLYRRRSASSEETFDNKITKKQFRRQATLTLITVDEDETRITMSKIEPPKQRASPPPPSYEEIIMEDTGSISSEALSIETVESPQDERNGKRLNTGDCSQDGSHHRVIDVTKFCSFFAKRPVLKLFSIIIINGFVSMAFAAIFIQVSTYSKSDKIFPFSIWIIQLEEPDQMKRQEEKQTLFLHLTQLEQNMTSRLDEAIFEQYLKSLKTYHAVPEEIPWNMLSASAYVNSVSSTTGKFKDTLYLLSWDFSNAVHSIGYGDIVAVTQEGKVLTIIYALYGIPIFMWYIIKLGALFRVVVMRFLRNFADCMKVTFRSYFKKKKLEVGIQNLIFATTRPIMREVNQSDFNVINPFGCKFNCQVPETEPPNFIEELEKDKRFHPSVIGIILVTFIGGVAVFISHMEGITYFDAFYACFITYSTVGFGDIDIYVSICYTSFFDQIIMSFLCREFHTDLIGST